MNITNFRNKYLFSVVCSTSLKDIQLYKVNLYTLTKYIFGFVAYLDVICIPIIEQQSPCNWYKPEIDSDKLISV